MPSPSEVTRQYRRQSLALRAQTIQSMRGLWPALDWRDLSRTYPAWLSGAKLVVARDRTRATGLASAYLKAHRDAAGLSGVATIRLAPPASQIQVETAMRVTTVVALKRAAAAGKSPETAMVDAFVQMSGAASRLVLNAGRETISATAVRDPRTAGWQRVGEGRCDFCQMLLGRGAVYTEETAEFEAHDHCACSAEPVYL